MVYGGTIRTGTYDGQPLDVISAFQAYGQYLQEGQTEEAEKSVIILFDTRVLAPGPVVGCVLFSFFVIPLRCEPGPGGMNIRLTRSQMYTANTMSSAAEVLGMTLPGSSSFPATSPEKLQECDAIGPALLNLLNLNSLPAIS
jgi:dihydroxy-acid dehydratase